ncbi:hypothetical protein A0O34_16770 [Chryseobacterium glaciei]|uniref:HTH araC/xylS-type domain-containing protein n=1 Tax=Chryseobacterium glaciei TaxID=1685010 RepID=A0A172XYU4_9FLAO|nr:AraC family transcriptional regulator [Chryseobacterium glaciei]ANF52066.1 hypothetical protein A0O34_16770 [Chryseobacterium glaciei]
MIKSLRLLILFIIGISCSNPVKKENITEESVKKEIEKIQSLRDSVNPTMIINSLKKVKQHAKTIKYDWGIVNCNLILMNNFLITGNDKESIAIAKENEVLIKNLKNNFFACRHYRLQGSAYLNLGMDDQGLNDLKKALEYNKKISVTNDKYFELAMLYDVLALHETIRGDLSGPNLKIYYQKELWAIQNIDNSKEMEGKKSRMLSFLYFSLGILSNKQKKTKEAENYFHKSLDICKKFNITRDTPVIVNNEMAWLLFDQKKYDSCIAYAQKGMILERNDSKADIRRDLYEVLYKSYSEKGDLQNSSRYTKLYMKLNDSILEAQQIAINEPVKNIIQEKEKDHQKNMTTILVITGISIFILAILTFFLWRRSQKIFHSRYENIISQLKNAENNRTRSSVSENADISKVSVSDKSSNIHDHTLNIILQKLNRFEKSEKFLKKDNSLTFLANSLETNPRYLSEIIKQYKQKNYNNYINGLRIQHIIQLLYKEPIYREYKITYLAEYCGFASREVFAIAFKKETGVTPSYFIEQLRND